MVLEEKSLIKMEPENQVEQPATASSAATNHTTTAPTDEDDLQKLSDKNAAKRKYPPGCPVWYNFQITSKTCLDANFGIVKAVYMNIESGGFIYRVSKAEGDNKKHYFLEDELVFALNCPVSVKVDKSDGVKDMVDAVIVCPKPGTSERKLSYTVQYILVGNAIQIETGVDYELISFRVVGKKEKGASSKSTTSKQQQTIQQAKTNGESNDIQQLPSSTLLDNKKMGDNPVVNLEDQQNNINVRSAIDLPPSVNTKSNATDQPNQATSSVEEQHKKVSYSTLPTSATDTSQNQHIEQPDTIRRSNSLPQNGISNQTLATAKCGSTQPQTLNRSNSASMVSTSSQLTSGQRTNTLPLKVDSSAIDKPLSAARSASRWEPPSAVAQSRSRNGATAETPSCRGKWAVSDINGDSFTLTVPMWVTDSSRRSLFHHMTGKLQGSETNDIADDIERITGCSIGITRVDKSKNIPIYITVKPMSEAYTRGYNMPTAKMMVEKSLLDFLESESAKARLINEWAASKQVTTLKKRKPSDNLTIEANDYGTSQRPSKSPKVSDKTCVLTVPLWVMQRCSKDIDLFAHILGDGEYKQNRDHNLDHNGSLRRPEATLFVRNISDKTTEDDVRALFEPHGLKTNNEVVSVSLFPDRSYCFVDFDGPEAIPDIVEEATSSIVKDPRSGRRVQSSFMIHGRVLDIERKVPKQRKKGGEDRQRGYKTREIRDQTDCNIHLSSNSGKKKPLVITIRTANGTNGGLRKAKRMITDSLMDFMCDPSSEMRLIYDLAMSATGTYNFRKTEGGIIQQECPSTLRLLYMKVLFLPLSKLNEKKIVPHGKFLINRDVQERLIGNTKCTIEVYGFGDRVPILSNEYVLISGSNLHDVTAVANEVDNALRTHQEKCPHGCAFYDEGTEITVGKIAQKSGKFYKGYDEY